MHVYIEIPVEDNDDELNWYPEGRVASGGGVQRAVLQHGVRAIIKREGLIPHRIFGNDNHRRRCALHFVNIHI